MSVAVFLLFLFALILWFFTDYTVGKHLHQKHLKERIYPLRQGQLTLFSNGNTLYKDLFNEIKQATKEIHILFYIVKHDQISEEFLEILSQKAKEGVTVRLLLDLIGSFQLPRKMIKQLKQSGVQFAYCNKPKLPFLFFTLNRRNHRKIAIIDGKTGYLGGFNIGQEYLGLDPNLGNWKDYHLKIKGEGLIDLQQQFLVDWREATKDHVENKIKGPFPTGEKTASFRFIATEGRQLEKQFLLLIRQAEKEIWIGTPYFIPSKTIMNALLQALSKGVNVIILVPMKADHLLVKEAAFSYFPPLLQAGARIFRYYYGFYHPKTIIIDEKIGDVGTANFDKRSLFLNEEINCYIYDPAFIQELRKNFWRDIEQAEELLLEDLLGRTLLDYSKQGVAKLIDQFL
ncbi:cardiolipin synthase [Priestia abyssalis]|uniref:cardiolipin synthase n=1 Tax=Priestia abyssalis TaxID=1221450 RepID=UPI0009952749|nr:cardiolipin synthase [Priestia abyssalis]